MNEHVEDASVYVCVCKCVRVWGGGGTDMYTKILLIVLNLEHGLMSKQPLKMIQLSNYHQTLPFKTS